MEGYDPAEAAQRSGIGVDELDRMVELGILTPDADNRFTPGHLRRAALVKSLAASGIPLEGLGAVIRDGVVSLDFIDAPAFERFSALSGVTFAQLAERTGVPVELLMRIREATGSVAPQPDDRVRDDELACAEMIEAQVKAGFRETAMLQLLRAQSDGTRRMAETESAMWQSEVIGPAMEAGKQPDEILGVDLGDQMSALTERSVIAMYHLQQTRAWTANIIEGFEMMLADAGLHSRLEHPPAMCFLDISGYTRLTQEHGDAAAAQMAEDLGRFVQRASVKHGGRAVKWLGDGVMLHFPNPGSGVMSALEMVAGRRRRRAAAGACRPACRAGDLPGGRLLRPDRQSRVADRGLRAGRRGDRQPGGGRRLDAVRRSPSGTSARSSSRAYRARGACSPRPANERAAGGVAGAAERDRRRADARGHQDDRRQGRLDRRRSTTSGGVWRVGRSRHRIRGVARGHAARRGAGHRVPLP